MAEKTSKVTLLILGDSSKARKALRDMANETKTTEDKLKSMGGAVEQRFKKVGQALSVGMTAPMMLFTHKATEAASDLNESMNAVNVVFGESSKTIHDFAQNAAKDTGLSARAVNELVTPMGAMLQNVGISAGVAADASVDLATRAADMASVFNTDVTAALEAIQAGLRGEADPLEKFGVGLNEAAVNAKAVELGLAATTNEVDANAKMQARLALIMEQTNKLAGDFANTATEAANAERIMKAEAENAAAAFGQQLLPMKKKLIEVASALVGWFNQLSPGMQKVVLVVGALTAAIGPLLMGIGPLISGVGALIGFFTGLSAAITAAGGVMAIVTGPIGLTVLAIAALTAAVILAYKHSETFRDIVQAVWSGVQKVIAFAWENVIQPVFKALSWYVTDILMPMFEDLLSLNKKVFGAVGSIIKTTWETVISPALTALFEFVRDDLSPVWETFRASASKAWGSLSGIVNGALRAIAGPISSFLSVVGKVANAIGLDNLAGIMSSAAKSVSGWGKQSATPHLNTGGFVPGSGPDRDSVLAYLTPGEFVLKRKTAQKLGATTLAKLNALGDIGLNRGGMVLHKYAKDPDEVLAEARRQSGKGYQWGGFGNPSFDCSGFMSWLSNYAATGSGADGNRWATAAATGANRLGRFIPGRGDPSTGFSIGVRPSGWGGQTIGHTAGTIAGVNVESSGSRGPHVGGGRGSEYGPYRYHLPDFGGPSAEMLRWFRDIKEMISSLGRTLAAPLSDVFRAVGHDVAKETTQYMLGKVVPYGDKIGKVVGLGAGGVVTKPTMALIGESGPEAVVPLSKYTPPQAWLEKQAEVQKRVDAKAKMDEYEATRLAREAKEAGWNHPTTTVVRSGRGRRVLDPMGAHGGSGDVVLVTEDTLAPAVGVALEPSEGLLAQMLEELRRLRSDLVRVSMQGMNINVDSNDGAIIGKAIMAAMAGA